MRQVLIINTRVLLEHISLFLIRAYPVGHREARSKSFLNPSKQALHLLISVSSNIPSNTELKYVQIWGGSPSPNSYRHTLTLRVCEVHKSLLNQTLVENMLSLCRPSTGPPYLKRTISNSLNDDEDCLLGGNRVHRRIQHPLITPPAYLNHPRPAKILDLSRSRVRQKSSTIATPYLSCLSMWTR